MIESSFVSKMEAVPESINILELGKVNMAISFFMHSCNRLGNVMPALGWLTLWNGLLATAVLDGVGHCVVTFICQGDLGFDGKFPGQSCFLVWKDVGIENTNQVLYWKGKFGSQVRINSH